MVIVHRDHALSCGEGRQLSSRSFLLIDYIISCDLKMRLDPVWKMILQISCGIIISCDLYLSIPVRWPHYNSIIQYTFVCQTCNGWIKSIYFLSSMQNSPYIASILLDPSDHHSMYVSRVNVHTSWALFSSFCHGGRWEFPGSPRDCAPGLFTWFS